VVGGEVLDIHISGVEYNVNNIFFLLKKKRKKPNEKMEYSSYV
jgi:hypothetical protein